ncbi:MAG: hypothetical protein HC803_10195 [Saprospiraceae bacterium]|nr:hypothetical protein [Saprospiraceae bacterium]
MLFLWYLATGQKNTKVSIKEESDLSNISNLINENPSHEIVIRLFEAVNHKIKEKRDAWGLIDTNSAVEVFSDFIEILKWISQTDDNADDIVSLKINKQVITKILFIVEFLEILKFKLVKFFEFTPDSAYLLFKRTIGIKHEYSEVFISDSTKILEEISIQKQNILDTNYPLDLQYVVNTKFLFVV